MESTSFIVRFYVNGELNKESHDILEVIDIALDLSSTRDWNTISVGIWDDGKPFIMSTFHEFFAGMVSGIGKVMEG